MDQVPDRHDWVMPDHARAGITHHIPDPLPHIRFVAVNSTVLAGGFLDPEGAIGQPFPGVIP